MSLYEEKQDRELDPKVRAVNEANRCGNKIYVALAPIFKNFVGSKVLKADGTLVSKVDKLIPNLRTSVLGDNLLNCYHMQGTLCWRVTSCYRVEGEDCVIYRDTVIHIGSLDPRSRILEEILPAPNLPEDYSAPVIRELRRQLITKEERVWQLRRRLSPFEVY